MPEKIEFELSARSSATGQLRSATKELDRQAKTIQRHGRHTKAGAQAATEYKRAMNLLGFEVRDATVAVRASSAEFNRQQERARAAGMELRRYHGAMGANTAGATAFARASTRAVSALGFISPTAATAAAQLQGLTNVSANATLALAGLAVGAIAMGGALIFSAKQAINFETSFRGIEKTVQGTEAEFASLKQENRALAVALGENVNTINKVGQAAGQLGIAARELAGFERIVIELASATDLTAESASLSFGSLIKILGLSISELDSLSDEVVALGNSYAATESEITGLLQRIAGAGAVLRIPADELVGIATGFSAVRVEQQAAGTAIQKVFLAIQRAAIVGGKELRVFSDTIGVTSAEFRRLVRTDPGETFIRFVEALSESGEEAQLILRDLGLTDQRLTRTFLKMAAAQGELRRAVDDGTTAYEEGTARTIEHERALDTTAGKLRIAKAAFVDLSITIGDTFIPIVAEAAMLAADFAGVLGEVVDAAKGFSLGGLDLGIDLSPQALIETIPAGQLANLRELRDSISALSSGDAEAVARIFGEDAAAAYEVGTAADRATTSILALEDAFGSASHLANSFAGELDLLEADIEEAADAAKAAQKALFDLFSAPTVEQSQAELAAKRIQQEMIALQTLQRPLTEGEKERFKVLDAQAKAAQRLVKQEALRRDVLKEELRLLEGGLLTLQELEEQVLKGRVDKFIQEMELTQITPEPIVFEADVGQALNAIRFLEGEANTIVGADIIVALEGDDAAQHALADLLSVAEQLDGQDYSFSISIDGVEEAIIALRFVMRTAEDAMLAQRAAFTVGTLQQQQQAAQADRTGFVSAGDILRTLAEERQKIADRNVELDAQSLWDEQIAAAKGAKKAIDPLKDGIISLAEALEFGITQVQAIEMELGHEREQVAERSWRVEIERVKATQALINVEQQEELALLSLAEAHVEGVKNLATLKVRFRELNIAMEAVGVTSTDVLTVLLESAIASSEAAHIAEAELLALNLILSEQGLGGQAASFRHALSELGEGFRDAEESNLQFLHRLAQAAQDAMRTSFDDLFRRPTREQAQQELRLAELRFQRSQLARGGRVGEDLERLQGPLDAQIAALEAEMDIRRARQEVMAAELNIADQTLLSDREQVEQANILIGLMADQSALTDTLNDQIFLESLARISATDGLVKFTAALGTARDVLALGPGQPIQVIVQVPGGGEGDFAREVGNATEQELRRSGIGGNLLGGGAFAPNN